MGWPANVWAQLGPATRLAPADPALPDTARPRTPRDRLVDVLVVTLAALSGLVILALAPAADGQQEIILPLPLDLVAGLVCCAMLWWRRRWPLGVALASLLVGALSISATGAGVIALFSLAVHRPLRAVLIGASPWVPVSLVCAALLGRSDLPSVAGWTTLMVTAAVAWGMFVRARRQLLFTLRERAERAEADQLLHADGARMAERARIAREMHDVLAHRISLVALHAGALEVRPDMPPEQVRATAELLRITARTALDELRGVIGVLREEPGREPVPTTPQPTLADVPRLVEESRRAGVRIELDMAVDQLDDAPSGLGRDAYRIVQESATNLAKHARGTAGHVRIEGGPGRGLHVRVTNLLPVRVPAETSLPGSGAGLLGLQERVALAGGELVHGPDGAGHFAVDAHLPW